LSKVFGYFADSQSISSSFGIQVWKAAAPPYW
jgi:hypothetical protein